MELNPENAHLNAKKPRGKPFEPGQSGNPNGRPRKQDEWSDIINQYLDAKEINLETIVVDSNGVEYPKKFSIKSSSQSLRHEIVFRMIHRALAGDQKMMNLLMDRTIGKP